MIPVEFQYRSITITGMVGVGKTTLVENLKLVLAPFGWKFHSASHIQREWIKEHKIPLEQTRRRPDKHERKIDAEVKRLLQNENHLVIDGWLAGFVAQGIPRVLKVLVVCSDDAVRIDRVANRDNLTIGEAKKLIGERERQNVEKWNRLYGQHNFWDPKLYDLIIDTYSASKHVSLNMVLEELGYRKTVRTDS